MDPTEQKQKVIQFNEKLFQKVLKDNEKMQGQLQHILAIARSNQQIQDHFEALEQKILKSRSLREMARVISKEIKKRFQMDFVTLCVALDPEDVLCKAQDGSKAAPLPSHLRIVDPWVLRAALPKSVRGPVLQNEIRPGSSPFFSPDELAEIQSKAVVPLFLSGQLIGTVNLGSCDPDRYNSDQGTDFLRRLGCKISLVMDNILAHQRLMAISVTDQLTGIANRRHFDAALTREVERSRRHYAPLACMAVDLDGFKEINDRLGHQAGDEALRHVASLLRNHSRRYDVVARYGGDEFAVLLPHTDTGGAVQVAEKFARQIGETPVVVEGESIPIGLSVGVAAIPETPVTHPEELVKEADRRLYLAKNRGGNQIVSSPEP